MVREKTITSSDIIELYKQGYSCKDICRVYNLSALMVRTCLRSAGLNTSIYRKVSPSNKEKILLLVKTGYSYREIESLLQTSTHLIREVIEKEDMVGFAPKNHPPIELNISEDQVSFSVVDRLNELYSSGQYGLAQCAYLLNVSDAEFLWFVFHLSNEDKENHKKNMINNIKKMYSSAVPVSAIAKKMDVSPSIVKKLIK